MTVDLEAIKARCKAATPGPWWATCRDVSDDFARDDSFLGFEVHGPPPAYRGQLERGADALFIANARTDVPALVAEVERLQTCLEEAAAHAAGAERACDELESENDRLLALLARCEGGEPIPWEQIKAEHGLD
ncbi:MAG: hypothetical protein M3P51_09205 [Chloroflexota bacterium]|nr:hypothetical protein [Chloroflexota bacterium]